MMSLAVVTSLLIILAISMIQPVAGGKRCWCDARINGVVVKDFGEIASCGGWCGCRNDAINRCGLSCDEKVHDWAENHCVRPYKGQEVRSHFKASNCYTGNGQRTFTCKYCSKEITKRVAYTCYKVVNDEVKIPCVTAPVVGPNPPPVVRPNPPAPVVRPNPRDPVLSPIDLSPLDPAAIPVSEIRPIKLLDDSSIQVNPIQVNPIQVNDGPVDPVRVLVDPNVDPASDIRVRPAPILEDQVNDVDSPTLVG